MNPSVGYLNSILARVGGNLNNNFQKSQMPGGLPGGGMLKLRLDRYISTAVQLVGKNLIRQKNLLGTCVAFDIRF